MIILVKITGQKLSRHSVFQWIDFFSERRSLELEGLVTQLQREVKQLLDERDCQVEMVAAIRGQNDVQKERNENDQRDRRDIDSFVQELEKMRSDK